MRHKVKSTKLGRTSSHRNAMLASLVCHLIEEKRITTTLSKAKAARGLAERMVTLGKRGDLAARRQAISKLRRKEKVAKLFDEVAPTFQERSGGYTRILKLGRRSSDSSEMAILEWVGTLTPVATQAVTEEPEEKKPAKKKRAPKKKKPDESSEES